MISMASSTGHVSQRPSSFGSGKNMPKSKMTLPCTCTVHGPEIRQWFSNLSTESGECLKWDHFLTFIIIRKTLYESKIRQSYDLNLRFFGVLSCQIGPYPTCLKKSLNAELGSAIVSLNSLAMALNSSCSSLSSLQNAGLYL